MAIAATACEIPLIVARPAAKVEACVLTDRRKASLWQRAEPSGQVLKIQPTLADGDEPLVSIDLTGNIKRYIEACRAPPG